VTSQAHAVLVKLFRAAPSLALDLLRATGVEAPRARPGPEAYVDLLQYHLGAALDRALEAIMATSERRYLSDWANNHYEKGEVSRARVALLTVANARGIELAEDERARVETCADLSTLDAWLARAARASSAAEIFAV
jgi:hypothetical protein